MNFAMRSVVMTAFWITLILGVVLFVPAMLLRDAADYLEGLEFDLRNKEKENGVD